MRARYVQVGEIRAVRLVEVVVAFCEGRVRGCYYGEEERGGCDWWGDVGEGEEAVFEDGVEDAIL